LKRINKKSGALTLKEKHSFFFEALSQRTYSFDSQARAGVHLDVSHIHVDDVRTQAYTIDVMEYIFFQPLMFCYWLPFN